MEKSEEAWVLIIHVKNCAWVPHMEQCPSTLCCIAVFMGPLAHPLAAPAVATMTSFGMGSFSVLPRQNQKHRNENSLLSSFLHSSFYSFLLLSAKINKYVGSHSQRPGIVVWL